MIAPGISDKTYPTKKITAPQPEDTVGEVKVGTHPKIGKGDIDAIYVIDEVHKKHEGQGRTAIRRRVACSN